MLAAIEFDEWPEAAHTPAKAPRSTHPLGVFDLHECGAWVDTLRALRALPNRATANHATASAMRRPLETSEDEER
ncbi:hypothetical protein [Dokdonella fugitiva]|uniref:Uncharacterized protein n=1 Tax=Dokdonella fugitiva TaxID=328517 RepID=A0A4R2I4Y5_9GAMM|nr:hypothetical protein [Dokdonella fugitiva]TCO38866.1 hypothetical protein EV148_107154 [Dokdonella fugitiva]